MTGHGNGGDPRPLVTVLLPAYNEAGVLPGNLERLTGYLETLADRFRWELVVVDDGSTDETFERTRRFLASRDNVRVFRHPGNLGLGRALTSGFNESRGRYIVVMDLDLTYAPEHIGALLEQIVTTGADIVVASPYMKGGHCSDVPLTRRLLSRWGNRFLAMTARGAGERARISTLTGMVRAYDGGFIRALNLKSSGPEINTEIIYKAMILGARIEEIPAHMDWGQVSRARTRRTSASRLRRGIVSGLFAGYIIRPFAFFIIPAAVLGLISLYPLFWVFYHVRNAYRAIDPGGQRVDFVFSEAVAQAFQLSPHAFIIGGITLVLAVQLFSLGILALQVKHSFEELFHFDTRLYANVRDQRLGSPAADQDAGGHPATGERR
jgi:glycosyltransferase involved in cell wall biosynthesis